MTEEQKERKRIQRSNRSEQSKDKSRAKCRRWREDHIDEQRDRERVKAAGRYRDRHQILSDNRERIKKECIEYKGGECSECGFAEHHAALEFHHIDRELKAARKGKEIGTMIGDLSTRVDQSAVFDKLIPELDLTVLLCSNCHRVYHWDEQHPQQQGDFT